MIKWYLKIIKISLENLEEVANLNGKNFTKQILLEKENYIPIDN